MFGMLRVFVFAVAHRVIIVVIALLYELVALPNLYILHYPVVKRPLKQVLSGAVTGTKVRRIICGLIGDILENCNIIIRMNLRQFPRFRVDHQQSRLWLY